MAYATATLTRRGFGETSRRDPWWAQPLVVLLVLGGFIVYATWAAFQGDHYAYGNYLSPFYSPEIFGDSMHSWFGPRPESWPAWLPFSPAFLILWAPAGFRLTCYYYRGAYYKAFWADPPACTVGEPRKRYLGERSFPLKLQNIHRYFLYLALVFLVILSHDAWHGFRFVNPATGATEFGMGIGSIVLLVNVILLGGYTLGCHSLRHVVGGRLTQISKKPLQQKAYFCVSAFNRRHMLWAWTSLVWVALSDVYIRLLSMGVLRDWRFF